MSGYGLPLPRGGQVAFVLKGYPRLSETFIAQEILALEQRGLDIQIVSLRHPTDRARHPVHGQIAAPVLYLPEYLTDEPRRVLAAWRRVRRLPGYAAARRAWLFDLVRDPTPNRIRRFGQALVLAAELSPEIRHLHAHFLHTPASVARYSAMICRLPWSVSAHAKDIWTTPAWEKREKLEAAAWAVTCTEFGRRHLTDLSPSPAKVTLSYHGLDLDRFPPPPLRPSRGDGSDPDRPVIVLSVGRAVEKKGYDDLIAALAQLPADLAWRFVHIGGGALARRLQRQASRLGLDGRVEWRGAQPQTEVLAAYRAADLFVLAAKIGRDRDQDGLPNVLMEAQSQRLACIATTLPGIAELIGDGRTGVLVPPGDPRALAAALDALIRDPALRARLGAAGEVRVRREFGMRGGIAALVALFGLAEPQPERVQASALTAAD
ncbi:MAG TPA: glycosyltransferase family 4 protein [Stellaceae bacterium]|jgi:glycosyltransferase involved in cell wall biosynthesis|nr:glycosyltransferase family 4 protein [Stellaceae bacterium]